MNIKIDISNVVLKTQRLTLREFKDSDLEDFYEYAKVSGVGEMAGWKHHESKEVTKRILKNFIEGKSTFAIIKDNKVIGSLGIDTYDEEYFKEFDSYYVREIGFVLSKDYWGQGLMKETVDVVVDYLFNECAIDIIVCAHYLFNNQSRRVQEKSGFVFYKEGKPHRSEIKYEDNTIRYSLKFRDEDLKKKFIY